MKKEQYSSKQTSEQHVCTSYLSPRAHRDSFMPLLRMWKERVNKGIGSACLKTEWHNIFLCVKFELSLTDKREAFS